MISYINQLKEAITFIRNNDDFLVVSHVNPDGDTISSSLAMAFILQKLDKKFVLVNEEKIPNRFNFLPMSNKFELINNVNKVFSNIITLDVADANRTGNLKSIVSDKKNILNIDHHPTNDYFGEYNVVLPTAAATAEVMYDLIKEMNIAIDKDIATCIYTGLLTDTGGFRYSNTSAKVMGIASQLLKYDISPAYIAELALETISKGFIKLLQTALGRIEIKENGLVAWTYLTKDDLDLNSASSEDTEGIVNYTRNIDGVEIGVFFKQTSMEEIKVSLRSKRFIDVGKIAKDFGGGGHARAAGFTYIGDLKALKDDLLIKIRSTEGWDSLE